MGNQRILLYFTLFFIVYMIWAQWQIEYGPKSEPTAVTQTQKPVAVKDAGQIPLADMPGTETKNSTPTIHEPDKKSERIEVITDVLDIEIDTKGGDVVRAVLRDYSVTAEKPDEKLVLITDENINYQVAQSGLVSANKESAPSHNSVFHSEKKQLPSGRR